VVSVRPSVTRKTYVGQLLTTVQTSIRHPLPRRLESPPAHRQVSLRHHQRRLRTALTMARSPRHPQSPIHPDHPLHPPHNLHPNPLPHHPPHINPAHPAPRRLLLRRRTTPRPAEPLHTPRVPVVSAAGQVRRGGHGVAHGIDQVDGCGGEEREGGIDGGDSRLGRGRGGVQGEGSLDSGSGELVRGGQCV